MKQKVEPRQNETWADLKQFAVGLALVYPFVAVTAFFARELLGVRTAVWFGLGLSLFATVAFALVAGANLLASYLAEFAERWIEGRRRARRSPHGAA